MRHHVAVYETPSLLRGPISAPLVPVWLTQRPPRRPEAQTIPYLHFVASPRVPCPPPSTASPVRSSTRTRRHNSHVCFHSSVLGFTSQRVLPLLTVLNVAHTPSVLGMELVTLVDRGGEDHSFGITAVEAGFPQRFCDLLKQCLVLCKVLLDCCCCCRGFRVSGD